MPLKNDSGSTQGKGFGDQAKNRQRVEKSAKDAAEQIDQGGQIASSIKSVVLNNAQAKVEQVETLVENVETQMAHRIAAAVNPDLIEARTWGKVGNLLAEYGRNPVSISAWAVPLELPLVRSVQTSNLSALYERRMNGSQQQQIGASDK